MSAYKAIVAGASAGGLKALTGLVSALRADLKIPVLVVQHMSPESDDFLVRQLRANSDLEVLEGEDKMILRGGTIYIAPPNYHMLVDRGDRIALSLAPPENYSRPSIDLLFESAAELWEGEVIAVILTGANADGSRGAARIKEEGGMVLVQDPEEAEADAMPRSALALADRVLPLEMMGPALNALASEDGSGDTDMEKDG